MNKIFHTSSSRFSKILGRVILGLLGVLIAIFVNFIAGIILFGLPLLNDLQVFKKYKFFFQYQADKDQRALFASKFFWIVVCLAGFILISSVINSSFDYLPFPYKGSKNTFFVLGILPLSFIPYIINRAYWYFIFLAIAIVVFFFALQS